MQHGTYISHTLPRVPNPVTFCLNLVTSMEQTNGYLYRQSEKPLIMKIKKNIALSDTGFVFNPSTGDSFSVNPIGLEILRKLKENEPFDKIKEHILTTYSTDSDTVEKDFYDFTKMLEQLQLTESDAR
jgi:hypothetical protein